MRLYIDLETRCQADLRKVGLMQYACHPTAGINCAAWCVDKGSVTLEDYYSCNRIQFGDNQLTELLLTADEIVAHNAQFEKVEIEKVWGIKPQGRWIDTMAKAAYYGYPRSLDDAAKALQCSKLKDIQGSQAMKKLCTGKFTPETAPDDFNRMYSYCANDVEVMREIDQKLPDLPAEIQASWELSERINQRGLPVDALAVTNALYIKANLDIENSARIRFLTGGFVETIGQVAKIQEWLLTQGVQLTDMTADTVARALAGELPEQARKVLQLRQDAGLSSLSKYEAMDRYIIRPANRMYFMFDWYGAHTGRYTSTGPQVHNFARSEEAEQWAGLLHDAPKWFGHISEPGDKLKLALRGCICCDQEHEFTGMDLAQIEARATGWLAGQEEFLDLFRQGDPYSVYGKTIFGKTISKKTHPIERTAAKASLLSLGFAGGIGAYQRVAENYQIDFEMVAKAVLPTATLPERMEAERNYDYYIKKAPVKPLSQEHGIAVDILKQRYRKDFAKITAYWDELEQAFLMGGQARLIHVEVKPSGLRVLTLPSGRKLHYHQVQVMKDGKYCYQGRKGREFIWKGTLIENCAQSINQDLTSWYMARADREIAPVVYHCHDEFTLECKRGEGGKVVEQLKELTKEQPAWSAGLPLGFDYWTGRRYGK